MSRHPSVQHLVNLLDVNENLPDELKKISQRMANVRDDILDDIKVDNPEVTAGLRKLIEAKDCFVRAAGLIHGQIKQVVNDATTDKTQLPSVNPADELPPTDGTLPA